MRIQRGFTLVELGVVISITATLLGLITISLVRSQQGASLTSTEEILSADLRSQQLKSMIGDTEGRASHDTYGIHIDQSSYTLFHGIYSAQEPSNFVVALDSSTRFNNPNFDVVFLRPSGQISTSTVIELQDKTNSKLKKIHLNTLGVITQVESL